MDKLPEGTTIANMHTIHKVHSVHYAQLIAADLIEENPKPNERLFNKWLGKIKSTGIYLQVDDNIPLQTYYQCTCGNPFAHDSRSEEHYKHCPAKTS